MFVSKVCAAWCLAMCDKDTEDAVARTRTGIKIGIGICEQKRSHAHSRSVTLCDTLGLAHILLLICDTAHSQTKGASCNIKKLLSYH